MCEGKKILFILVFLMVFPLVGQIEHARSQEKYPTRPIDIICGWSPGGATDLATRIFATFLKKKWGVAVNVVNKPGGGGVPAALEVYQATADGYTMLVDNNGSTSSLPVAIKHLPFEVMDRTFVATGVITPQLLLVPSTSPITSMKDLEAEVKKDPGKQTWGSTGGTGIQDFCARQFFKAIGVDVLKTKPIMTKGGTEVVILVAGGHLDMTFASISASLPAINGATVKPLAITSKTRWPDLPNVATTAELGYPTVNTSTWVAITGPPKLPSNIVDIWNKAFQEMTKDPEVISQFKKIGASPFYLDSTATREYVLNETKEARILWGIK